MWSKAYWAAVSGIKQNENERKLRCNQVQGRRKYSHPTGMELNLLDTVPEALPNCLENYCSKLDDVFGNSAQRGHFKTYTAGLLSECHRKNIMAIAESTVWMLL